MHKNTAEFILSTSQEAILGDEAMVLAKAASILLQHKFQNTQKSFSNSFSEDSLMDLVPSPLFAL